MITFLVVCYPAPVSADSSMVAGGGTAQASLSFRIIIPHSLYLQIQSARDDATQTGNYPTLPDSGSRSDRNDLLDIRAYGRISPMGSMHLASSTVTPNAASPQNHTTLRYAYLWMPNGVVMSATDDSARDHASFIISNQNKGSYSFQMVAETPPPAAKGENSSLFVLCSP